MVKLRESLSEKGQDSYRIKKVVQYRMQPTVPPRTTLRGPGVSMVKR